MNEKPKFVIFFSKTSWITINKKKSWGEPLIEMLFLYWKSFKLVLNI